MKCLTIDDLKTLNDRLSEESPYVAQVLQDLRNGDIEGQDALSKIISFLFDHPELDGLLAPYTSSVIPRGGTPKTVKIVPPPSEDGLPRLNPVYEAALAERALFDGDVPEARSGPLPKGAEPAVPVKTTACSPVAVGLMLEQASKEVADEYHGVRLVSQTNSDGETYTEIPRTDEQLPVSVPKVIGDSLVAITNPSTGEEDIFEVVVGPDGYRAGQAPSLRVMASPSGGVLSSLTHEQKREAAWRFLSTTQGRRSALAAIRNFVAQGLEAEGFSVGVNEGRPARGVGVPIYVEWSVGIGGGNSTNPDFDFIGTASNALCKRVLERLASVEVEDPILEVIPINTTDVRKVGWAARIITGGME